jgi:hypothetical protein
MPARIFRRGVERFATELDNALLALQPRELDVLGRLVTAVTLG